MKSKSFLSELPKPLLKRAGQLIQRALNEQEEQEQMSKDNKIFSPCSFSRTIERDSISLGEVTSWAKSHYPENEDVSFILMKGTSKRMEYDNLLFLFYTKNNKPLLDEKHSSLAVYTCKLDATLEETFGDNDIIEFE